MKFYDLQQAVDKIGAGQIRRQKFAALDQCLGKLGIIHLDVVKQALRQVYAVEKAFLDVAAGEIPASD